jgi:hypothetical protein
VLANTQQLHERIEDLCSRIRELESALGNVQSKVSNEQHPLLRNDLLQLKSPQSILTTQSSRSQSANVGVGGLTPPADPPVNGNAGTNSESGGNGGEGAHADDEHFIDAFGKPAIKFTYEAHPYEFYQVR